MHDITDKSQRVSFRRFEKSFIGFITLVCIIGVILPSIDFIKSGEYTVPLFMLLLLIPVIILQLHVLLFYIDYGNQKVLMIRDITGIISINTNEIKSVRFRYSAKGYYVFITTKERTIKINLQGCGDTHALKKALSPYIVGIKKR